MTYATYDDRDERKNVLRDDDVEFDVHYRVNRVTFDNVARFHECNSDVETIAIIIEMIRDAMYDIDECSTSNEM